MKQNYCIIYEDGTFYDSDCIDVSKLTKLEKVTAHFQLKTESRKPYADMELYDENGAFIDSCFVSHKWENVNLETWAYSGDGKRLVVLRIKNENDEGYQIRNVAFNSPMEALFDGGVLYQIAPKGVQMMGYVYVTKQGEVIAIDGGGDRKSVV